jgi:Glutathione S-transferase, C-terminal domain
MQKSLARAKKSVQKGLDVLESNLSDKEFVTGSEFTAADVMLVGRAHWAKALSLLLCVYCVRCIGMHCTVDVGKRYWNDGPMFDREIGSKCPILYSKIRQSVLYGFSDGNGSIRGRIRKRVTYPGGGCASHSCKGIPQTSAMFWGFGIFRDRPFLYLSRVPVRGEGTAQ